MRELFPAADIYLDVRPHRGVPLDLSRAGPARRASGFDGQRHPLRRDHGVEARRHALRRRARRASWSMPGRWSPRAIGTIRSAPPSGSSRRRAARAYGGMAVWSGDRVRRDEEGLLYFVGREDAMIKTCGNRVSPTEVEEAAVASGLVAEAVALGFPDDRLGEAIALDRPPGPARRGGGAARLPEARACPISCSPGRSSGATSCRAAPTASSTAKR